LAKNFYLFIYSFRNKIILLRYLDVGPLVTLEVEGDTGCDTEETDRTDTHELAILEVGLGSPSKERGHVLGHLASSGRGAVCVLDHAVVELLGHGNGATGKVGVVVQAGADLHTSGRILKKNFYYFYFGLLKESIELDDAL